VWVLRLLEELESDILLFLQPLGGHTDTRFREEEQENTQARNSKKPNFIGTII
jgi:hypothetical protein